MSSATVARRWPDAVEIVVLEERPAVVLDNGSTGTVVSSTGRVLALESSDTEGSDTEGSDTEGSDTDGSDTEGPVLNTALLPRLGIDAAAFDRWEVGDEIPDGVRHAATVFARMSDTVRAEIPVGHLDRDGAMTFDLDEATVVFGPVEDVPQKLAAIESLLTQVVRDCMARVDVREPNRPTVSRVDGCDLPAPLDAGVPTDTEAGADRAAGGAERDSTAAAAGGGGA